MQRVNSIPEMMALSDALRREGRSIGLVPTMGALHEGHLSLVRTSVEACAITVATIFVNPTQFGPNEDFNHYPRTLETDAELLRSSNCDLLLTLEQDEMYPQSFETWVEVENLPNHLCGLDRPHHFRGVTTVVSKLLNIVKPHVAYFGWKDAQQALIIKRMVKDLNFGVDIRLMPTVRDKNGLALSSRNQYLTAAERKQALLIPGAIDRARDYFANGGRDAKLLANELRELFAERESVQVDYISLVRLSDLEEAETINPGTMLAMAVRVGNTRLIDNHVFTEDQSCSES